MRICRHAKTAENRRPIGVACDRGGSRLTYSNRSLHGQVAHDIGARILRGDLEPGAPLPTEADFSIRLKVSRTALREAIKVLAAKGLVESRPKTGTRVRPRDDWNLLDPDVLAWQLAAGPVERFVSDLFELRQMIEPPAAAIAARRATPAEIRRIAQAYAAMEGAGNDNERWIDPDLRFHLAIMRATGNELLGPLGAMIETALITSFRLSAANPEGPRHSLPLHSAILAAIRRRDATAAAAAMQRLLAGAAEDVRRALETDRMSQAPRRRASRRRPPIVHSNA